MLADPIENFRLLYEADIFQRRFVVLLNVRGDDFAWIADQKTILHGAEPATIDPRQQVMRHLLLIKNVFPLGDVASQSLDNISPVRLAVVDYFIGTGMITARRLQVMRVERLIAQECVRAISPRPHHRGGDVPRSGPHRDADRFIARHRRTF